MRILLIEDDAETSAFVRDGLTGAGHEVVCSADGREALARLRTENYEVAVVDRLLPGIDGISIVREVRAAWIETRIIFVTTLAGIAQRVEGLDAGADDYLVKPFALAELVARVNALARRPTGGAAKLLLRIGDLELDLIKRKTTRGGKIVALQPVEFKLLETLMRKPGHVFTRTMLLEQVWNFRFDPQTTLVETHISRLRRKVDRDFSVALIETAPGGGYFIRDVPSSGQQG